MARSAAIAWGRLLRLSLSPSAPADAACGAVLAAGAWPAGGAPWLLMGASLSVFCGGMALNDWADREADAHTRPERPIPSGRIPARAALVAALALLAAGCALGLAADLGAGPWIVAAALAALVYDLVGRGPWCGPLLLGICRASNLSAGLALGLGARTADAAAEGASGPSAALFLAPLVYGAYTFAVSRLARFEDQEDRDGSGRRQRAHLLGAAAAFPAAGLLLLLIPSPWATPFAPLVLLLLGALGPLRLALRGGDWTGARAGEATGVCLRRLIVLAASFALMAEGPAGAWVAGCALAAYPLSRALARVFPPT